MCFLKKIMVKYLSWNDIPFGNMSGVLTVFKMNVKLTMARTTKGYSIKIYLFYVSLILPYVFLSSLLTEFNSMFNPLTILTISFVFQIFFSVLSTSIIGYLYKDVIEKKNPNTNI